MSVHPHPSQGHTNLSQAPGGRIHVQNAETVDVLIASASLYDRRTKSLSLEKDEVRARCMATLERAMGAGYDVIRGVHVEQHSALFSRTSLQVCQGQWQCLCTCLCSLLSHESSVRRSCSGEQKCVKAEGIRH